MARPNHHPIHAPPSTPKTPVATKSHAEDGASPHQAAQQEEEGGRAADWTVFSAQGLHMDQSMLAQAHAAMLTIESEGARLHLPPTSQTPTSCTSLYQAQDTPLLCVACWPCKSV